MGQFKNMESVTQEVKAALDPAFTPAIPLTGAVPENFGAKDIRDLSRVNLMNAYACTECGRCTAVCLANLTGKLLSPRKIMMATGDRLKTAGRNINPHGKKDRKGD